MIKLGCPKKIWFPGIKETKKQIDEYNKESELEQYMLAVAELVKEVDALKIELIEHLENEHATFPLHPLNVGYKYDRIYDRKY